ncbi:transcriptional regulator [Marivibrio halodurans]|uniref:Transcriptional regulator n=1 Tax=Marivibrio halodurans TaxID=2039722 RepID=A0A8J7S0V9_9PROT|nr:transcriptional regulator [Marivibrio halodurans]
MRRLLKHGGPQRADDLAGALGLTAMAVRQHLYAMADAGEVEGTAVPQARGRPAKHWALTSRADAFFADGHADLAVGLIESLRRTLGEAAMERLLADRTAQQIAAYRARVGRYESLYRRLRELAAIRGEEGYMAAVEPDPDGAPECWLLVENHCPICHAARACTGLCAQELTVFREVLGEAVSIERTDHLLDGARRCAYRVRARDVSGRGSA